MIVCLVQAVGLGHDLSTNTVLLQGVVALPRHLSQGIALVQDGTNTAAA